LRAKRARSVCFNAVAGVRYTFVQCGSTPDDALDKAAHWIEKYAKKHGGRVITNFDERSPVLSDAPLSYQRLIKGTYERTIIGNLHLGLAERIDVAVTTEYNNYGQVGAFGEKPRSDKNKFLRGPSKPKGKRTIGSDAAKPIRKT
jgi:hypothetical protein